MLPIIIALAALGLSLTQLLSLPRVNVYQESEALKWVLIAASHILFALVLLQAARQKNAPNKFALHIIAPILAFTFVGVGLPKKLFDRRAPAEFLSQLRELTKEDDPILANSALLPSVSWYLKRTDIYSLPGAGELTYGALRPDQNHRYFETRKQFLDFISSPKHADTITLVERSRLWNEIAQDLPKPKLFLDNGYFVIAQFRFD
jgi:hypothetical protein